MKEVSFASLRRQGSVAVHRFLRCPSRDITHCRALRQYSLRTMRRRHVKNAECTQNPGCRSWTKHVRSTVLHAISLVQFATACTRGWVTNSLIARIRLSPVVVTDGFADASLPLAALPTNTDECQELVGGPKYLRRSENRPFATHEVGARVPEAD